MYLHIEQSDILILLPILIAFCISFFTSMGGVSGAFLLLPVQLSVFHLTGLSVTPTLLLFNIIAIPGGVWRYIREQRMVWPLAWILSIGTIPGLYAGGVIRIRYLPDPRNFKVFAACVLAYLGIRLLQSALQKRQCRDQHASPSSASPWILKPIRVTQVSAGRMAFEYDGRLFTFNTLWLLLFSSLVGLIGGIYGIGGGAIIAPFLVSFFGLPVHAIAGAALLSSCLTSLWGLVFYLFFAGGYTQTGAVVPPYWSLGLLFGIGGIAGTYCGARLQKFVAERLIIMMLTAIALFTAVQYIYQYFH